MRHRDEEARLIDRALSGDSRAFESLVKPIRKLVYNKAVKAVKDLDVAEDIAQEVILRVYTKLHTFRKDSALSTWVFTIARNTTLMYFRSEKRRKLSCLDGVSETQIDELLKQFNPSGIDQEEAYRIKHVIESFNMAVDNIPPKYAKVLTLWVNGKSMEEIGIEMSMTKAAIKSRIHRARSKVRLEMGFEEGTAA